MVVIALKPLGIASQSRRAKSGFTLLETLIVLVLISLIVTVTTISTRPDPRQALTEQAKRVGLQLTVASEDARLRQRDITWEAGLLGYRFVMPGDNGPEEVTIADDDLLKERRWNTPLTRLSITELASGTTRTLVDVDAPPVRVRTGREWVQQKWRLDLSSNGATVSVVFDAMGQGQVVHAE